MRILHATLPGRPTFRSRVQAAAAEPLRARQITTIQANIGYRCNLACRHCHIQAGPDRSEIMDARTIDALLLALRGSRIPTLDITGGAPELNPDFRRLVAAARGDGAQVIVRTNLAIFLEEGMADLPEFYRDHGADLVASLPCYLEGNVDNVRGNGTFARSLSALRRLNALGYGMPGGPSLNLVFNPPGASLPPDQEQLEQDYRRELAARYGISFTALYTVTNMPLGRFRDDLSRSGGLENYLSLLACAFNPATLDKIMCRSIVSVGPDGRLFDCDFNQTLGLAPDPHAPAHIRDFDVSALSHRLISTDDHCFGCTAGRGST